MNSMPDRNDHEDDYYYTEKEEKDDIAEYKRWRDEQDIVMYKEILE